jgi:hypothetical protein
MPCHSTPCCNTSQPTRHSHSNCHTPPNLLLDILSQQTSSPEQHHNSPTTAHLPCACLLHYLPLLVVSEDLLKLAQVAFDQEQGQQGAQDPYAAMQQFDPAAWAAYGGMAGMGGMNAAMLTNYYWGQPMGMPSAYPSQRHPSLSKPEHQGK